MYVLDGRKLRQGRPFTHNGIQYPGNWLALTSADEKAAIGITWEADPAPFNSKFYFSADNPRDVVDVKPSMLTEQDTTARNLLNSTDWYVVRKSETDTAIPVGVTSFGRAGREAWGVRGGGAKEGGQSRVLLIFLLSLEFPLMVE